MTEWTLDLRVAAIAALAAAGLIIYLLLLMVGARAYGRWVVMRRRNSVNRWRAFLSSDEGAFPANLEVLGTAQTLQLMREWLLAYEYEYDLLTSGPRSVKRVERLRSIAAQVAMDDRALSMLRNKGTRSERIIATQVLGAVRSRDAWPLLLRELDGEDELAALAAAEALVGIRAEEAADLLTPRLSVRTAWPEHVIGRIIRHLEEPGRKRVLQGILEEGDPECIARVFRALEGIHHAGSSMLLQHQLDHAASTNAVMQLLYASQDESHISIIEHAVENAREGRYPAWGTAPWMLEIAAAHRPAWASLEQPPEGNA